MAERDANRLAYMNVLRFNYIIKLQLAGFAKGDVADLSRWLDIIDQLSNCNSLMFVLVVVNSDKGNFLRYASALNDDPVK